MCGKQSLHGDGKVMNATCCCLCIVKLLLTPVTTHEKLHRLCVYTSVHHLLYQNVLHFVLIVFVDLYVNISCVCLSRRC